jgi:L-glutamine-phosphate cytidylyltransferase
VTCATTAIIVAAGMGNRLRPYTDDVPKCLLDFGGKTLLERQIDAYRAGGIRDFALVRGYRKELFTLPGIRFFDNDDYENNNILNSVFCAEPALRGDVIVGYSDILFEPWVVTCLTQAPGDISVVVDVDWKTYYVGRKDHPIDEAENVIFDADGNIAEIGKKVSRNGEADGEFIGMMKLTARGCETIKEHFHRARARYWGKPFQRTSEFRKAYLTDLIQEMVDQGVAVHCTIIARGWKEIDTVEDYEKALREIDVALTTRR